jgi:DNA-binding MarR family transcriptional regulator
MPPGVKLVWAGLLLACACVLLLAAAFRKSDLNLKAHWLMGFFFGVIASGLRRVPVSDRDRKECDVNPEPYLQLNRVIHEKGRLAIMSMLAASPELSFTELRDALAMTDGNLTTHIRALQQEGYVAVAKSFQNRRPLTTCSLTTSGRKAFADYINLLERIVQQNRPK